MITDILSNAILIAAQILGHPLVFIPFSLFILISVIGSFCTVFFGSSSKSNDTDDLDESDDLDEESDDLDDDLYKEPSRPDVDRRYTVKVKGYNRSLGSYSKR